MNAGYIHLHGFTNSGAKLAIILYVIIVLNTTLKCVSLSTHRLELLTSGYRFASPV